MNHHRESVDLGRIELPHPPCRDGVLTTELQVQNCSPLALWTKLG